MTHELNSACKSFGIHLLDHIVLSDSSFFSFADDRLYGA